MNNPEGITVISHTWKSLKMHDFFNNLEKNDTFGFSKAFTMEEITEMASTYGVRVRPLPKNHPHYNKYGEWMLKVSSINSTHINEPVDNTHVINLKVEKVKEDEVCHRCRHYIIKGNKALISRTSAKLRRAIDKKYYCKSCGTDLLSRSMNNLVVLLKILS